MHGGPGLASPGFLSANTCTKSALIISICVSTKILAMCKWRTTSDPHLELFHLSPTIVLKLFLYNPDLCLYHWVLLNFTFCKNEGKFLKNKWWQFLILAQTITRRAISWLFYFSWLAVCPLDKGGKQSTHIWNAENTWRLIMSTREV